MVISFGIEEMHISETACAMRVNQKHLLLGKKKRGNGLNKEHLPKCQVSMMDMKLWFLTPSSRQGCFAPALKTEMKKIKIFWWGKLSAAAGLCTEWLRGSGCSRQALVPKKQSSRETESWKVSQSFNGPVGNMPSREARCSNISLPCTRGCRQPQPCLLWPRDPLQLTSPKAGDTVQWLMWGLVGPTNPTQGLTAQSRAALWPWTGSHCTLQAAAVIGQDLACLLAFFCSFKLAILCF